jgi:manganese/zinc/iron transport system substrate-binding protein
MSNLCMSKWVVMVGSVVMGLLVGGCDGGKTAGGDGAGKKPKVVATTSQVGDLVRQIAGDEVELVVIMGPGVDPHSYKATTADLGHLATAQMVFYNGLHLEGTMAETLQNALGSKAVAVTQEIPLNVLIEAEKGTMVLDPHVWFEPRLWADAARTVGLAIGYNMPGKTLMFKERAARTAERILAMEDWAKARIATIPEGQRVLITSHDAYNYFGRAFGIEVKGLQGISTETEAGLGAMTSAVDFIVDRKIPAIFVESSVSPRTIERVQADVRARGHEVVIGGELYSDAMGTPGSHPGYAVETWEGMFRFNVDTIVKALGGQPSSGGEAAEPAK